MSIFETRCISNHNSYHLFKVTVAIDFKLIDTWQLWKRFQEEIPRTKAEMCFFMREMDQVKKQLEIDVANLLCLLQLNYSYFFKLLVINADVIQCPIAAGQESHSLSILGRVAVKKAEIRRLNMILSDGIEFFDITTDEDFFDDLDFTPEEVEMEVEDELLDRLVGTTEEDEDMEEIENEEYCEDKNELPDDFDFQN